jgi:hypothetical protein
MIEPGRAPAEKTFCPVTSGIHITVHTFAFICVRKVAFGAIISALKACGIMPVTTDPDIPNHDNKSYARLPSTALPDIRFIMRTVISGLCIERSGDTFTYACKEHEPSADDIRETRASVRPRIPLGDTQIIAVDPFSPVVRVHKFGSRVGAISP